MTLQDTLLLRHMLWSRPEDEERISDWLIQRLAAQGGSEKQVGFLLSSLFGRTCHSMQACTLPSCPPRAHPAQENCLTVRRVRGAVSDPPRPEGGTTCDCPCVVGVSRMTHRKRHAMRVNPVDDSRGS